MLTKYIGMNVVLCYIEMFGKSATKTSRIQNSSGSDDLIFRKSGNLGEYICHDIYRITYNDI